MASNNRLEPYEKKLARDRFRECKLSDYCLESIVKFFDRHMLARTLGTVPARHYEFLQIAYSKKLFDEMSKIGFGWPSTYEDFFLNEYIKEITIKSLACDMEFIINRLYNIGPNLKRLSVEGATFTDDVLCQLSHHLPNVKSLAISRSPVAFKGFWSIMKHCGSLEHLTLHGCVNILDEVIQDVFQIGGAQDEFSCKYKLKELDLRTHVTAVGMICILNYFPNLTRVDHWNIHEAVLNINIENAGNNISSLKTYNLTELRIDGICDTDESCFRLCSAICPHLVKLSLSGTYTQVQIDALTLFPALREVNFENFTTMSIDFSFFLEHNGKKLEVLKVASREPLSISVKSLINSCPNLRALDVRNVEFKPIEENCFLSHKLNKLKDVGLTLDFLTPYAVESVNTILSLSPNLEALDLSSCESILVLIDSIIDNSCLMNIRKLDISWTNLTSSGVKKVLLTFPKLEKCMIQSDLFSAKVICQLVEELPAYITKTLKKLTLAGATFTDDVLCQLSLYLPNVTSLALSCSSVAFKGLWSIMKHCGSLECLVLHGCWNIVDEVIQDVLQIKVARDEFACKYKLKVVDLLTPVTAVGWMCILNYFPNLTLLAHWDLHKVVLSNNVDNLINNVSPLKTYNLTELIIEGSYYKDDHSFRLCSIVCPHLIKFVIYGACTQVQIDALTGFLALEEVIFENKATTNINFSSFLEHNGKKLEILKVISKEPLIVSVKSLINSCPNLRILSVRNVKFERIEENGLLSHKFTKLKDISLTLDFLTPYAVESVNTIISLSPKLEALDLSSCKSILVFIDSIIDNSCLMNIRKLDISWTNLTSSDVKKVLLTFPKLEKCSIHSINLFSAKVISQLVEELPTYISKVWIKNASLYEGKVWIRNSSLYDWELYFLQAP